MHARRFAILLSIAAACAMRSAAAAPTPTPVYVDMYDYFSSDAQFDAWQAMTSRMVADFDEVCGDTFCEGDYSDIRSLRYVCSVEASTGRLGQCSWIFAGSYSEIAAGNGRIDVHAQVWPCATPLAPHTTMAELLDALGGDDPLFAPLPHSEATLYDGLVECL